MSAPVLVSPGRESNDPSGDPAVEAAHLRRLIEGQPNCLMRLDLEGRLLAANASALGLLGADGLGEALGRSLSEQITLEHQGRWRDFADRVRTGASASVECELTDFAGSDRVVLMQAVPLLDHPDAVPSMIVGVRDITASRHLEQVLEEREVEIEIDTALDEQQRIEQIQREATAAKAEQERLEALLAHLENQHAQLVERHAAEQAHLRQTLAEEHQLAVLLVERDARLRVEVAHKELEQARLEHQRLMALVEVAESARQRLEADLARSDADAHGLASDSAGTQVRLREAIAAEQERTATVERELMAVIARLERDQIDQMEVVERLERERTETVVRLEEELAAARGELAAVRAEQEGLERQRENLEQSVEARERLAAELQAAAIVRAGLEAALERAREEHDRIEAELVARDQEWRRLVEESRSEIEERERENARLRQELSSERQAAVASAEQVPGRAVLQEALDEAQVECQRLRSVVEQQDGERQRLAQVQAAALDNLRAALVEERELALLAKERDARVRIDEAEAGLARALEERQRLRTVLQESEAERERLLADQAARRIETEHALAAAAMAKERMTKALADQQVELKAVVGNALALEAVACAGRVAREVGRELQDTASSMDRRAQDLLQRSAVDAGERHEIEALRAEAVAIASLARQLLQTPSDTGHDREDGERTEG